MRLVLKSVLALYLLLAFSFSLSAQHIVQGVVTDSLTKEPIPYASVHLQGTSEGTTTGSDGRFYFKTSRSQARLIVSTIGYNDYSNSINPASAPRFNIALSPTSYSLNEVTIKPKRERYRKKDNPAVDFVRQMIEQRKNHSPNEKEYWQRDRYEKTTFALNNFNEEKQQKWLYRKFKFLTEYVDTSAVTGKPILTVSARELLATDYYRNYPKSEKQVVKARKQAGVDEIFSKQGMQAAINEVFKDVDIYENNISLFTNKFVSPLSRMATGFYKYYLMDTLQVAGERCVDLTFVPYNSESFGFTGHLYVTLDSTYFVKRAVLNFPKKINLNFVEYMLLEQEFKRAEDGTRMLDHESITVEFKLAENTDGIFARRIADYNNYSFEPTEEKAKVFEKPERIIEGNEALSRSAAFWTENRPDEAITEQENSVDNLMTQLRSYPVYFWTEKVLTVLFTGYIPTSKEAPLFYIGPMNATISGNSLEGARVRVGGMTTAWLNPHWFGKGYMAYGFNDNRLKGLAEVEYSFKKKKEYANEFPIHSLKMRYESDVNQYGQNYLYTSKDNVFLALKRKKDDRIGYYQQAEMTYTNEFYSGFSFQLTARRRTDETSSLIPFLQKYGEVNDPVNQFSTTAAELKLRYAPNEKFFQTQWNRFPVSLDAPVFTLSHAIAGKGVLGSDYTYNHTEAGIQKRFWFSAFGYTDVILKAGKVWDKVPFPLLIMPNANLSYTIQPESYSLMNAMEFINDEYFSWDVTYFLNGWLFNRVPLFKKLKWREVLSCRGLYGNLSDKNNPALSDGLFAFPATTTSTMGRTPYVEVGVGVENIFKVLRFDYLWRLTYRELPGVDNSGLRISLHMTF